MARNLGASNHSPNPDHRKAAVLQFLQPHGVLRLLRFGEQSQWIKFIVSRLPIVPGHVAQRWQGHGFGQTDPDKDLFHAATDKGVVSVDHLKNDISKT